MEEDFEWVTDKLVQIANTCCSGRIVSVLEGGYQLGGEYCSAFAQSAKVRATAAECVIVFFRLRMCARTVHKN